MPEREHGVATSEYALDTMRLRARPMRRATAIALGFPLAALVPVCVGSLLTPHLSSYDWEIQVVGALLAYFYSLIFGLVFGGALFWTVNKWARINAWSSVLSGLLVGAIVVVMLPYPARITDLVVMPLSGALSAWVFWLVWRRAETA